MEDNLKDQIVDAATKNVNDSINETLEAKASNESVEAVKSALETKAAAETVVKNTNDIASLQKQMNEMEANATKGTADAVNTKRNEWVANFEKAQSEYKANGTTKLDLKTFVPGTSTSTLVPSAYATEGKIYHNPNFKTQLREVLSSRTEMGGLSSGTVRLLKLTLLLLKHLALSNLRQARL